ncbi:hypothetical protein LFZ32_11585 [Salmonella enterica subsp. enterica serovar Newport str. L0167]|nr:hypothetical protein LFZ32_11585 [Salmonella enterica subsp. enterica serovar Newport str. L0167]
MEFFREPLSPSVFAKVVYLKEGELIPVDNQTSLEKIRLVRRQAKEKVFVTNCLRALRQVSPGGSIRDITFVVLVGGSSLDFEIPQMITDALAQYGVVAGQGNIRGTEGPRNAVATGLVLAGEAQKIVQKTAAQAFSCGVSQRKAMFSLISRRSWVHSIKVSLTWLILRIRACQQQLRKPWILLVV